jgi:zinc protease
MYEGLSGASSAEDLETLFQLAYLRFTAPRPDSAAFLAYRSQARASLANRQASPDNAFVDTLRVTLSQGHLRAMPPSVEMFDQLDMERSFEIYRDRFADASDFTFFVVGSFTIEEIRPLVETYLASLPSIRRVEAGRDVGIRPPTGVVEKVVYRGLEPRAATQLVFTGPIEFDRDNVVALQGLADVMTLRLRERLRESLGGTYGVEVRGNAARDPVPRYQFSIAFGSDPDRVDELVDEVFHEISRVVAEGPTEDELEKVREMQFRSRETSLRQNQFWLAQLINYDQYGWGLEEIATVATRFETMGSETIRNAAREYLSTGNYVRVSLLPGVQSAQRVAEP